MAKNFQGTHAWGGKTYPFLTNSLGLRDGSARSVAPQPAGRRVLFIGDSFTEGVGVSFDDSFVGLVFDRLAPADIDVLNAGVTSYAPAVYYRKSKYLLEEAGVEFDHLVVLIDISDIEDEARFYRLDAEGNVVGTELMPRRWIRDNRGERPKGRPEERTLSARVKRFLKDNSVLLRIGDLAKDRLEQALADKPKWQAPDGAEKSDPFDWERSIGLERALWTVEPDLYEAYGAEGLRRAGENMDRLLELLQRHDVGLTVVVYPWPDQIMRRDLDSRQVAFWQDWTRDRGVSFVNLFPAFISQDDGEAIIRRYFIPGDVHWNPAGHQMVAERLVKHLSRAASAVGHPCLRGQDPALESAGFRRGVTALDLAE